MAAARWRWRRDIFAACNSSGQCLFHSIGSTLKGVFQILAESGYLGQVGTNHKQSAVVVGLQDDRINHVYHSKPRSFLI